MTMDVRELLSWEGLDTSGTCIREFNPKETKSHGSLLTPLPTKLGDFPGPVDTSSQVSSPDDAEMGMPPWRKSPLPPLPQLRYQGPNSHAPLHMQAISGKRPTRI